MGWWPEAVDWLGLGGVTLAGVLGFLWQFLKHIQKESLADIEKIGPQGSPGHSELDNYLRRRPLEPVATTYRRWMRRLLAWLRLHLGASPWSASAYAWCLTLSVAYPIVSLFLFWLLTGHGKPGVEGMLPEALPSSWRMALLFWIGALIVSWVKADGARSRSDPIQFTLFVFISVTVALAGVLAVALADPFSGGSALFFIFFAFVSYSATLGAPAGSFIVALAVAFAGGSAVTSVAGVFIGASAYIGLFVFAYVVVWLVHRNSPYQHVLLMIVLPFCVLGTTFAIGTIFPRDSAIFGARIVLVHCATLPLINGFLDWKSLGVTRFLLQRGFNSANTWRTVFYGLADLAVALLLLVVLALTITVGLRGLNVLALASGWAQPLIDLPGVLGRLRVSPADPAVWWVYVMLCSTLLPSAVHGLIAIASPLRAWPPKWLQTSALNLLDEPDLSERPIAQRKLSWRVAFLKAYPWVLAVGILILLIGLIGWFILVTDLLGYLLWLAETTASVLGAEVTPGGGSHVGRSS